MPTATIAQWMTLIGCTLGVAAAIGVAWWAISFDRQRDRRRCPNCWFDMRRTSGLQCTECGHTVRQESSLYRVRRRPVFAFLGILSATVLGLWGSDHLLRTGWPRFLPTAIVAGIVDRGGMGSNLPSAELRRRAEAERLSLSTWRGILRGAADGSSAAPVGDPRWLDVHGPWAVRAWRAILAADEPEAVEEARGHILAVARAYPPVVELVPPPRWPTGRPVPIAVHVREPWGPTLPTRLTVHPGDDTPASAWMRVGAPIQLRSFTVEVQPLPPGRHTIELDVDVERALAPGEPWEDGGRLEARTLAVVVDTAIPVVGSADLLGERHLEPVDDALMRTAIASVFDRGAVQWEDGGLPVRITVNRGRTSGQAMDGVAVGLEVELRRNGAVGRTLELWWMGGTPPNEPNEWSVPFSDDELLRPPTTDDDAWTLRITGREDLALRAGGGTRWWSGRIERPIRIRRQAGMAPSRGWFRIAVPDGAASPTAAANPTSDREPVSPRPARS